MRATRQTPAPIRQTLFPLLARNAAKVGGLIAVALGIGAAGYHFLDGLPWLDATLNAAMILTGMGPVSPIERPAAKAFAIVYALFGGVFFLTMVAVLLAPALHHFLHHFHLEFEATREAGKTSTRGRTPSASQEAPDVDRQR